MQSAGTQTRILYFGVRDSSYPRNERIRNFLETQTNSSVTIVRAPASGGRSRRYWSQIKASITCSRDFDVVILSEFSLNYFLFSWIAARRARAVHIVDFFVGLHETEVGDAGTTQPHSLRAKILSAIDHGAILSADYCFTDTPVRASRFSKIAKDQRPFLALPVGAPAWARARSSETKAASDSNTTQILYYGSFLALHGLPNFVSALVPLKDAPIHVTLIGDGPLRADIERQGAELGLSHILTFVDPVSTATLAEYMSFADVIIGIFGSSEKAREVVANKVWQGLYMGKTVLTRDSPALTEIKDVVGGALELVPSGDSGAITKAILGLRMNRPNRNLRNLDDTGTVLENYVQNQFRDTFSRPPLSDDIQLITPS
ncbi:glycosyltransferase [Subtercola sp. PAMC28395]|uniref:glycosyltransferase n=1 Tax=Subtercola sp. PAMC28395 TaxID=2846775 RepID=UPI001C0C19FB|nr:glycosyltransferase [Subtercola sp. PAMC28395]QWT24879.1 glycosyltransferase [Subtercola sp. PAMC28395]